MYLFFLEKDLSVFNFLDFWLGIEFIENNELFFSFGIIYDVNILKVIWKIIFYFNVMWMYIFKVCVW